MSDSHARDDQQAIAEIEAAIRAAGDYVWPSDDLRPRTLETARELSQQRRAQRRLGRFFLAVVFLMAFGVPLFERVDSRVKPRTAPSAIDMQRRALEHAARASVGPNWGMLEAFTEWRRVQASHLGRQ